MATKTPWLLVRKRIVLTEGPPRPAKLMPTCASRECCVVSKTSPHGS
jgi:hypothetical protein